MTNEIKTEAGAVIDSAAGAVKQLVTTIDQWPISLLIVAVLFGIIIVLRSVEQFPNKRILPLIVLIGMAMNGVLGSRSSIPADQTYPALVMAFKGLLLGLIACGAYSAAMKLLGKKLPLLRGSLGGTIEFRRDDIEDLGKENKPKSKS